MFAAEDDPTYRHVIGETPKLLYSSSGREQLVKYVILLSKVDLCFSYAIGVFDKKRKKVKIVPVQLHELDQKSKKRKLEEGTSWTALKIKKEYYDRKTFNIAQKRAMYEERARLEKKLFKAQEQPGSRSYLPKYDPQASEVSEVYDMDSGLYRFVI